MSILNYGVKFHHEIFIYHCFFLKIRSDNKSRWKICPCKLTYILEGHSEKFTDLQISMPTEIKINNYRGPHNIDFWKPWKHAASNKARSSNVITSVLDTATIKMRAETTFQYSSSKHQKEMAVKSLFFLASLVAVCISVFVLFSSILIITYNCDFLIKS